MNDKKMAEADEKPLFVGHTAEQHDLHVKLLMMKNPKWKIGDARFAAWLDGPQGFEKLKASL